METKPLSHYMGLDFTDELTCGEGYFSARVRELPGCWSSVNEDEG